MINPGYVQADDEPNILIPSEDVLSTKRKLSGQPLAELVYKKINQEDTLLGDRYLCRKGGMLIVAPSGHGKGVLSVQAAIEGAVGRPSFGIKPKRPLNSIIIQAEDDEGDCIEMSQIVQHLGITGEDFNLLRQNVWLESLNDLCGCAFIEALDGFLEQRQSDVVIINPLTAYLGSDDKDTAAVTKFLRNQLNPILGKHDCAAIVIHHTPKTNFASTDNYKPSDWMYRGAGAATITNWARAILVIDPLKIHGVYKFIAAKRGKRIGWGYERPAYETHWAHSEGNKLLWVPANEDQIKACQKTTKTAADLLEILPIGEQFGRPDIQELAKAQLNIGRDKAAEFINNLIGTGALSTVSSPRKGTRPEVKYVRNRDIPNQGYPSSISPAEKPR